MCYTVCGVEKNYYYLLVNIKTQDMLVQINVHPLSPPASNGILDEPSERVTYTHCEKWTFPLFLDYLHLHPSDNK